MLGALLDQEPYLSIHKRLLQAKLKNINEYQNELVVARNQLLVLRKRAKEAEEQDRLRALTRNDNRERKHMKANVTAKSTFTGYTAGNSSSGYSSRAATCNKPTG